MFCIVVYTKSRNMRLLIKSELNLFVRGAVKGSTKKRKKKPNGVIVCSHMRIVVAGYGALEFAELL